MYDFDKMIIEEVRCIDNFVKEVDIVEVTDLWLSICYSGFTLDQIGYNTTTDSIANSLYKSYRKFIENISPANNVKYINFYEKYFNKTWCLILDKYPHEVKKDLQDLDHMYDVLGHNRWWEDAYKSFGVKI